MVASSEYRDVVDVDVDVDVKTKGEKMREGRLGRRGRKELGRVRGWLEIERTTPVEKRK